MSLFYKETRNKKTREISSLNFATEKQLKNRINRLKQKANSAQDYLIDIQVMQDNSNMDFFDIIRRHDYNKVLEQTESKINGANQKLYNKNQELKGIKVSKSNRQQRLKSHLDGELNALLP